MAKRVINRTVYNTETAELIHEWWNGYGTSDFKHMSEDLYKTKKGNFFLLGSGGAMTKYSVDCGNGSTGGSSNNVIPISKEGAIDWLESHDGSEKILELFPDELEDA